MQSNENILIFRNNMSLAEEREIIQTVLNQKVQYNKVILLTKNDLRSFGSFMKNDEKLKRFWSSLGKTVTTLEVLAFWMLDEIKPYFINVRTFHNNGQYSIDPITPEYVRENFSEMETIILSKKMIRFETLKAKINVDEGLITILEHCTKSLKNVTFDCEIPLEIEIINEIFADINYNILQMDETIFECDPVPASTDYKNFHWIIERIEMKYDDKRLLINPQTICDKISIGENICQENCSIKHLVIKSNSVVEFSFKHVYNNGCFGYFTSLFESFPFIQRLTDVRNCNESLLWLMFQKLVHLQEMEMAFQYFIEHWPPFSSIRVINITFQTSSNEQFEHFVKSYPDLISLTVQVMAGILVDDCVKIVSEHLEGLQSFEISCDTSQVTVVGLDIMRKRFQCLKYFRISCSENKSDVKRLFHVLPKLEVLEVNAVKYFRSDFRISEMSKGKTFLTILSLPKHIHQIILSNLTKRDQENFKQALETNINDLPIEVLDETFSYLERKHDQLRCRQVCRFWFKILSSSIKCNRSLNLENAFFSWKSSPVKLFINTKFSYNELVLNHATIFDKDENFSDFWANIGKHINNIRMYCSSPHLTNIFDSGFQLDHLPKLNKLSLLNFTYNSYLPFENTPSWKSILSKIKILRICYYFGLLVPDPEHTFEFTSLEELQVIPYHSVFNRDWEVILECLKLGNFPSITRLFIFMKEIDTFKSLFETQLKFNQLKIMVVVRRELYSERDLKLILMNCPQLQSIGFGFCTNKIDMSENDFDCHSIFKSKECLSVVKVLFEKLVLLSDIYFFMFCYNEHKIERRKLFSRVGVNSFKQSQKSFQLFDFLQQEF